MSDIFLKIINMSITASWIVPAVLLARVLFRKAPKWINCLLWGIVGLRLVMPFSFESVFSLIPSSSTINNTEYSPVPSIQTGVPLVDEQVNGYIGTADQNAAVGASIEKILLILSIVWLAGVAAMLLYSMISYLRLKKSVAVSLAYRDNIYYCDNVSSPFILGIIKPRIYVPSGLDNDRLRYVAEHETAHLERMDHWWKPLGFVLLSIHWFNPVMWLAYILLCRDIELACDEKVIKQMDGIDKKGYSETLVECSLHRRAVMACPLAFGEVGVKSRIRSVLNYKKPALWLILIALTVCVAVAVSFLTDPKSDEWQSEKYGIVGSVAAAECENIEYNYVIGTLNKDYPYIEVKWVNNTKYALSFTDEFTLYKNDKEKRPITEMEFGGELNTVMPNTDTYEMYSIGNFDIGESGNYRIEKQFWLENEPNKLYRAYIDFTIDRTYSFLGSSYKVESVLLKSGNGDFAEGVEESYPLFKIGDNGFQLYSTLIADQPTHSSNIWSGLGTLVQCKLKKSNFDKLIADGEWQSGYSAEKLREDNLNAFYLLNTEHERIYCLLEQKNGDIIIACGRSVENRYNRIFKLSEIENTASEKLELDPPVQSINDTETQENFKYTDLKNAEENASEYAGESFADPKVEIYNKMLNTIDHFNDVELTMQTTMLYGGVTTVYSRTDIDEGRAYESITHDGEVITEDFYAENKEYMVDNRNKTCLLYYRTNTTRADSPYIPLAERTFEDEYGIPCYVYRRNISGCPMSSYTIVPQELTFSYLADFDRWSIAGDTEYLGRECIKIEGTTTPYFAEKHSSDSFEMTVDKKTGILLDFKGFRNGEISHFISVSLITFDSDAPIKAFNEENYTDYELKTR